MNAVKSGGLAGGIEQCKIAAPEISQYLEEKYSSKLISAGRTSLKIRNPQNLPDTWQKTQLQIFDQEQNKGLQPSYRYRVIQQEGRPVLEYISPIPTQGLCLNCHGEVLNMEVTETLRDLYPEDQARGYKAGDIRGAFIIRSWLDKSTTGMKK
nr:DUF3365 domain-containing protein [Pseudoteredinibacter isoporae]